MLDRLRRGIMRREGRRSLGLQSRSLHVHGVADATSHLALTHTVHKMTEILTGWDAGGLLCKNIPVLRQMCPRGRVGKIALQMLSVTI